MEFSHYRIEEGKWRLNDDYKVIFVKFIAKTLEGLEDVLCQELAEMGVSDVVKIKRAVLFSGPMSLMYEANLRLRTALRVLWVLHEFDVNNEDDLYHFVKRVEWETFLGIDDTLAVDSVVNSEKFRHSNYIALKTKDAIVDRFREKSGQRPSVDVKEPTLRIHVHIRGHKATLALDSSGYSLHMRGYRTAQVDAPLNEVLAAGLVLLSGWDKEKVFIDPMCGSGTLLCEAAFIALNIPPHIGGREFGFMRWRNFDPVMWKATMDKAYKDRKREDQISVKGFDISTKSVQITRQNLERAGLSQCISVEQKDFFYHEDLQNVFIIMNPPYDIRLKEEDVSSFYKNMGDKLKLSASGSSAWLLSGQLEAVKKLGLRPSKKIPLLNGSIETLFLRYDLYAGSKKQKYQNK